MVAEGTDDDRVSRRLMEARRVVEGQCSDCGVRGWVLVSSRRCHGCHDRVMRLAMRKPIEMPPTALDLDPRQAAWSVT